MMMKTLTGILAAAISMPALAGPNWDVIHEAEAHHLARHEAEHVLPLDYGPRAITTPWLNKLIFAKADKLGYSKNYLRQPVAMDDDHIPFVNAGVSAVDLIDFDYGPGNSYWHTAGDTVEHCSATSLTIVGRVVLATLDRLANSPRRNQPLATRCDCFHNRFCPQLR